MSAQRTILSRLPIPALPGWESRTVLLEYPPGAVAPPHDHPVDGANYVVEGELISQWEGEEPERFSKGDVFIDYAQRKHVLVKNASETEWFRVVVTYVIPVDQPNVRMVEE